MKMRTILAVLTLVLAFGNATAAAPKQGQSYQVLLMANFVNGMCQAKEQAGVTTIGTDTRATVTAVSMTDDERNQCAYVRSGLAAKCFERGDCPSYDDWLKARVK